MTLESSNNREIGVFFIQTLSASGMKDRLQNPRTVWMGSGSLPKNRDLMHLQQL
jgi:hypothetical protein